MLQASPCKTHSCCGCLSSHTETNKKLVSLLALQEKHFQPQDPCHVLMLGHLHLSRAEGTPGTDGPDPPDTRPPWPRTSAGPHANRFHRTVHCYSVQGSGQDMTGLPQPHWSCSTWHGTPHCSQRPSEPPQAYDVGKRWCRDRWHSVQDKRRKQNRHQSGVHSDVGCPLCHFHRIDRWSIPLERVFDSWCLNFGHPSYSRGIHKDPESPEPSLKCHSSMVSSRYMPWSNLQCISIGAARHTVAVHPHFFLSCSQQTSWKKMSQLRKLSQTKKVLHHEYWHGTWKWTLGRVDFFWTPSFSESMLLFRGVYRIMQVELR